jgi:hypothetical protein
MKAKLEVSVLTIDLLKGFEWCECPVVFID